ncbi:hypothetical protein [Rhodoferax sp.]|uniref:hypothetical protein n=1 Tax=Rhodoferax sp. TaxID=50421 RepID=UPI0025EBF372|nr:hypothetical protein [Rhodoferax sp.]
MLHFTAKTTSLFATALLGIASCLPAMAADDELVFFCPPIIMAAVGQPTTGIMCDAEHCFHPQSPELNAKQKVFLQSATGQCRYFTVQEVNDYWPKETTQQASK